MDEIRDTFYSEKISIQPDLGDLRKSTDKALPAPPVTPKRVLMKYRFSATFAIAVAVTSFVLVLVLVLAGKGKGTFGGQYLLALDTSALMQGAQTQQRQQPGAVVADVYYLHLQHICYGYKEANTKSIIIRDCETYTHANSRITAYLASTCASTSSTCSLSLVANVLEALLTSLSTTRHVLSAFLIIALASSALSALSAVPAIVFPHSPLLAYCNVFWPCLASIFVLLAAMMTSVLVPGLVSVAGGVVGVVGLRVLPGNGVLLLVWLSWGFVTLDAVYWGVVWWVEVRRWGMQKSTRTTRRVDEEIGRWMGRGCVGRRFRDL